jgi:uncharacterized protein (TIGR00159 family)
VTTGYFSYISEIFQTVRWHDWLDIGIVAFLLYRCFVLFWGTLVFRAIIGVTLLWVFDLVANTLGMIVTSLILRGIGAIIVIIVVVIFRNEIRGVVVSTSPLNLFWGKPRRRRVFEYGSISEAIFALADKRVGALVVFTRTTRLDHLIQDGVRLDANFSRELLFSIFDHGSVLHDGAVIIDGSRIAVAAAFLPLTMQGSLPLQYGTRHRAALGLSDRSDAVIAVVSEERGEVSLACGSSLKKIADEEQLSGRLKELIEGETKRVGAAGTVKRTALDIAVKMSFLILAIVIWFFFAGEKESVISYTAPIEFRNLPKSFELMSISADRAEVQVAGSRRLIMQLKPEEIGLSLNLTNSKAGKNSYSLTRMNIAVPPGFNVIKINPHEITVVMEERETKTVEVITQWIGTLPEGKRLVSSRITPDRVAVFGAPSVLKAITSIKTEPIDLSGVEESDAIEAAIILPTASVSLAPGSPPRIRVDREIINTAQKPEKKKQKTGKAPRQETGSGGARPWSGT